ncbi:RNase H domain-containing protein [Trichonephila clavipes]|nr:RNase H domain-containing protein [Trichonephila clavipes]
MLIIQTIVSSSRTDGIEALLMQILKSKTTTSKESSSLPISAPVLEYAAPIWAPASVSSKQKLDSIQHRASKVIIGAVSSTNNEKAEREWVSLLSSVGETLPLLSSPTNYDVTRKITSPPETFHFELYARAFLPQKASKRNENYSKSPAPLLKERRCKNSQTEDLETIEKISQENFAVAYTDGSSDISLNKGGAGILFQLPNKEKQMHKINTGLIASNFTSELLAIKEVLILYSTHLKLSGTTEGLAIFSDSRAAVEAIIKGDANITSDINVPLESLHFRAKSCLLQWIPAHVNIEGNECADSLAKEGRNDDQLCPTITLADCKCGRKLQTSASSLQKPLIVNFDCSRYLTSIIARLRTGHFKGMKISSDKTRTYIPCKNCTEAQLTPDHILECPALTPHIIWLGMVTLASELRAVLYSADAPRLAEAVQSSRHYLIVHGHDKKTPLNC